MSKKVSNNKIRMEVRMSNSVKLSKYFTFNQLTVTTHSELRNLNRLEALWHKEIIPNLKEVASKILDVLIDHNCAIVVTSGYRCSKLNKAVGGSIFSHHKEGRAVDFYSIEQGVDTNKLFWLIQDMAEEGLLKYHKLIYYPDKHFIHCSLPTGWRDGRAYEKTGDKIKLVGDGNES